MNPNKETPENLERLRLALDLDETTGVLTWKRRPETNRFLKTWNTRNAGKPAGHVTELGYILIRFGGASFQSHRIIFAFTHGFWPPDEIDHKDGDPTNNLPDNLRSATRIQNIHNTRGHKDSKSGIKGVTYRPERKKWRACLHRDGKQRFLGNFNTAEEAQAAYSAAAYAFRGEFVPNSIR